MININTQFELIEPQQTKYHSNIKIYDSKTICYQLIIQEIYLKSTYEIVEPFYTALKSSSLIKCVKTSIQLNLYVF